MEKRVVHISVQNGAGHYVKMVHNGIEYGDMQLICEAYFMMKHYLVLKHKNFMKYLQNGIKANSIAI